MELLLLLGLLSLFGGNSDKKRKKSRKSYRRRTKRDNSWLDYAWFHDHNQRI